MITSRLFSALLFSGLFLTLQQSQRADALRHEESYNVAAPFGGFDSEHTATVLATRGGDGDGDEEDRKKQFEDLLRRAQVDPDVLNDETNALSSLGRLLSVPGPLPDLMSVCTMAAVHQSDIFKDGPEAGKEAYKTMKMNFAKEFEEALKMGGIEISEEEEQQAATEESKRSMTINKCIEFLGSDHLHA